jgi:hypothetical protein
MLHCAVAWWLWVPGTRPQKAFRQIARPSGDHCSIGFQPVSGVSGLKPAESQRPFPDENHSKALNFAPFNPELSHLGLRAV